VPQGVGVQVPPEHQISSPAIRPDDMRRERDVQGLLHAARSMPRGIWRKNSPAPRPGPRRGSQREPARAALWPRRPGSPGAIAQVSTLASAVKRVSYGRPSTVPLTRASGEFDIRPSRGSSAVPADRRRRSAGDALGQHTALHAVIEDVIQMGHLRATNATLRARWPPSGTDSRWMRFASPTPSAPAGRGGGPCSGVSVRKAGLLFPRPSPCGCRAGLV